MISIQKYTFAFWLKMPNYLCLEKGMVSKEMIDIKLIRENPELVKENIKKKWQNHKLELIDKVLELDKESREMSSKGDSLRSERNKLSDQIGLLMKEGKKEEAETIKAKVKSINEELIEIEKKEDEYKENINSIMLKIPNIMHESVPIRKR